MATTWPEVPLGRVQSLWWTQPFHLAALWGTGRQEESGDVVRGSLMPVPLGEGWTPWSPRHAAPAGWLFSMDKHLPLPGEVWAQLRPASPLPTSVAGVQGLPMFKVTAGVHKQLCASRGTGTKLEGTWPFCDERQMAGNAGYPLREG